MSFACLEPTNVSGHSRGAGPQKSRVTGQVPNLSLDNFDNGTLCIKGAQSETNSSNVRREAVETNKGVWVGWGTSSGVLSLMPFREFT
jgi:hypothetical protein